MTRELYLKMHHIPPFFPLSLIRLLDFNMPYCTCNCIAPTPVPVTHARRVRVRRGRTLIGVSRRGDQHGLCRSCTQARLTLTVNQLALQVQHGHSEREKNELGAVVREAGDCKKIHKLGSQCLPVPWGRDRFLPLLRQGGCIPDCVKRRLYCIRLSPEHTENSHQRVTSQLMALGRHCLIWRHISGVISPQCS